MKKNYPLYVLLTPLLIGSFSAISYYIGTINSSKIFSVNQFEESAKINHVLDVINNKYVDSVNKETLIENSIFAMLEKLDPHSSYIPAKEVANANESLKGHFGGIGIRFPT